MRRVVVLPAVAAVGLLAFGVGSAGAAVTQTQIATPSGTAYYQANGANTADPAHQMTVSGTSDGTTGDMVDIVCTSESNTSSTSIASGVAVQANGTFSWTGPAPNDDVTCQLHAIPSGTTPSSYAPYPGPVVGLGELQPTTVTGTGTANDGKLIDYYEYASQTSGNVDYQSLGDGGLYDTEYVDPTTLHEYADLFYANDYIADDNSDRADILIDGVPAFDAYDAQNISTSNPGLPQLTWSSSTDPSTGNVTIHESEPLVRCTTNPTTWPATSSSCSGFTPTGVTFSRTIVQGADGDQAHITDLYTSTDGQTHSLNVRYGQDFRQSNPGFNFPWVDGSSYSTHSAGNTIPAPTTPLATMYVNYDNTLPDGALNSDQGSLTFTDPPQALAFVPNGKVGQTHLNVTYLRSIPAGGSAQVREAFSWGPTRAFVQNLAQQAVQSFSAPSASTGQATNVSTTAATVAGQINPNQQDTTYHFDYGTTTSYGASTAGVDAGSGATSVAATANLTGLLPNTTYHYRVVATNGSGTTDGTDQTFSTGVTTAPPSAPPAAAADAATLPPAAASAGLSASTAGRISTTLQCPAAVIGVCETSGTVSIAHGVIARFSGVKISSGQSAPVVIDLTPTAIGYLQAHGLDRIRATVTTTTTLDDGQSVTATQYVWLDVSAATGCHAPTGRITAHGVGVFRLGMGRRRAHRNGHYQRTRTGFERYCVAGGRTRVAYASHTLADVRHVRIGRIVLALTGNRHYAIRGVRTGTTVSNARRHLRLRRPLVIGRNAWYFVSGGRAKWVLKAQHGVIDEIGVAAHHASLTRTEQRYLLRHLK